MTTTPCFKDITTELNELRTEGHNRFANSAANKDDLQVYYDMAHMAVITPSTAVEVQVTGATSFLRGLADNNEIDDWQIRNTLIARALASIDALMVFDRGGWRKEVWAPGLVSE